MASKISSNSTDAIKKELLHSVTSFDHWARLFFIIVYFFIKKIVDFIILLIAVLQFLFKTFTSQTNVQLLSFSKSLSYFAYQILLYITYGSDERPFPFSEWPNP